MRHLISTRAAIALLVVATAACGHTNSPTAPSTPTSGTPQIASVAPGTPTQNPAPQLVTVRGRNFSSGLRFTVTMPDQGQLVLAGTDIQAAQPDSFASVVPLLLPGRYTLTVTNSDGQTSAPFTLTVAADPSAGTPVISMLTPAQATHDAAPQIVALGGVNFTPDVTLSLTSPGNVVTTIGGGSVRDISSTWLEASVLLSTAGSYTLAVVDETGRKSNSVTMVVK